MKNPVVAVLILVSAAVGGIAAFYQDIYVLKKAVTCFSYELGIMDYEGVATLTTRIPEYAWIKVSPLSKVRTTRNHHCESDCDDEPTRTGYNVFIDAPPSKEGNDRVLRNVTLKCQKGPCGGWNDVVEVKLVNGGKKATASFDVWSKPTTWKLSADLYERQLVDETETSKSITYSASDILEISTPRTATSTILRGKASDGSAFSFDIAKRKINETDHTGIFRLLRAAHDSTNDIMVYDLEVTNPNCDS